MTAASTRTRRRLTAALLSAAVVVVSGCGPKVPDYQSIWTSTTPTTTSAAQGPLPISQYLESVGVTGESVTPEKLTDLTVTLPTPPGWQPYRNVNLEPGTRVIAKGETYPTAMLVVVKLTGDFNVTEAIGHGYVDAERSEKFKRLNASNKDWRGMPSSMIEGSYDLNGRRMQSYNRIVIATGTPARPGLPGQKYLIQFTVTSFADQARADGPEIETIIKGFTVAAK